MTRSRSKAARAAREQFYGSIPEDEQARWTPKWKVHTPNLLKEILVNPNMACMAQPLRIFGALLAEVAERAIALNDPEMNKLMMRLTLYEQADPHSADFDAALFAEMTA